MLSFLCWFSLFSRLREADRSKVTDSQFLFTSRPLFRFREWPHRLRALKSMARPARVREDTGRRSISVRIEISLHKLETSQRRPEPGPPGWCLVTSNRTRSVRGSHRPGGHFTSGTCSRPSLENHIRSTVFPRGCNKQMLEILGWCSRGIERPFEDRVVSPVRLYLGVSLSAVLVPDFGDSPSGANLTRNACALECSARRCP
jgi:hypothetical protein